MYLMYFRDSITDAGVSRSLLLFTACLVKVLPNSCFPFKIWLLSTQVNLQKTHTIKITKFTSSNCSHVNPAVGISCSVLFTEEQQCYWIVMSWKIWTLTVTESDKNWGLEWIFFSTSMQAKPSTSIHFSHSWHFILNPEPAN